jgi:L,D-transpeptidase YcbB
MRLYFLARGFVAALLLICSISVYAGWASLQNSSININYKRLQKALDYYESLQTHSWPIISLPSLKLGGNNINIPELRERLRLTGDLPSAQDNQSELYDEPLIAAVKQFQWRHGLEPDGVIGSKTLRELNVSPYERAEEIRRNMQRWAALPQNLGDRFIFINIPEYKFDLIDHGKSVVSMKIIVGKPDRPTPELTSLLTQVELNPYWNVPTLIAKKDILPKILKDPTYLDEMNIKVVQHNKSGVTVIDSSHIDWQEVAKNGFSYEFRQEPGKKNALGLVKFDFSNPYDVYMHDTPAKELFNKDNRIFSSGCIRLEKPFELLSYLLNDNPEWDVHRVADTLQAGKLTYIKVKPVPIYIIYATAWVDSNGLLHFTRDPYGYNEDPNPDDIGPEAMVGDPFTIPLSFYA